MTMSSERTEMEDAAATTSVFLFDTEDVDNAEAEAAMQPRMVVTRRQANLQAGSSGLKLALMVFLR